MQIDLHHTAIYVLCRIAGMKSQYAEIVAYSSQFVDDAVHRHSLKFKNGGVFKQTMTAHRMLTPRTLDVNDVLDVWIPFHFPPRGDKEDSEAMMTAPNSKVLGLLLEDVRTSSWPHSLYRLGIGLHYLADAYSHSDFKGIYDIHNDVQLLAGINEKGFIEDTGRRISGKLLDRWSSDSVAIGHLEVLENPDIPYAQWSYSRGNKILKVNNLEDRYLPAVRKIHEYLVYYLTKNQTLKSKVCCRPFDDCQDKFRQLLSYRGSKAERYKNWLKSIKNNYFEFGDFDEKDGTLYYDDNAWFNEAVEASKVSKTRNMNYKQTNYHSFKTKPGFEESHWVKFMQAAAEHKFLVVHCLLPELGIIVG